MLVSNRATNILLVLILAVGIGIVAMLASGVRGGPLDPPGPPGPSGTQPQSEPRMPIPPVGWNGTFPITISQSGSYFFTQNLAGTRGVDGIDISSGDVTIDLNGFTLSNDLSGSSAGIYSPGGGFVRVHGGVVRGWARGLYANSPTSGFVTLDDCQFEANNQAVDLVARATVKNCVIADSVDFGVLVAVPGTTVEDNTFIHDATDVSGQALFVTGGRATIKGNRFSGDVGYDLQVVSSNNIFENNTWQCNNVVVNNITNSVQIDFLKDGTNVCFP
jgi:hypothetical protein